MVKFRTVRLSREDFPDVPDEIGRVLDRIFGPINQVFQDLYNGFNKNIDNDNLAQQIQTNIDFRTSATYTSNDFDALEFPRKLKSRAIGVEVLQITEVADQYTPIRQAVSLSWRDTGGNIKIDFVAGLENSKRYRMTVRVT